MCWRGLALPLSPLSLAEQLLAVPTAPSPAEGWGLPGFPCSSQIPLPVPLSSRDSSRVRMLKMRFTPSPVPPFYGRDLWPGRSWNKAPGSLMELQLPLDTWEVYLQFLVNLLGFGMPGEDIVLLDLLQAQAKVFPRKRQKEKGARVHFTEPSEVLSPTSDFFPGTGSFMWKEYPSSCLCFALPKGGDPIPRGISSCIRGCRELWVLIGAFESSQTIPWLRSSAPRGNKGREGSAFVCPCLLTVLQIPEKNGAGKAL